jgi:type I restriction enzyme S subunit
VSAGDGWTAPYDLPEGWNWAELSRIASIGSKQLIPRNHSDQAFNYIALENIEQGTGRLIDFAPTMGAQIGSNKYTFGPDHVLFGKLRPYLRKVFLPDFEGISATDLLPIRPNPSEVDRRYLARWLLSPQVLDYVVSRQTGVKMPRLRTVDLEGLPVPIPPLAEQRRLVKKIERLLEESRTARDALDRIPPLLKRFRQAILAKAFRGELTERDPNDEPASVLLERIRVERRRKWEEDLRARGRDPRELEYAEPEVPDTRGMPELPKGWAWANLDAVAEVRSGVAKGRDLSGAALITVPYLRVANVQAGYLDLSEVKSIEIRRSELDRYGLIAGDVLFTEGGDRDKLGRGTVWEGQIQPCVHQNHIHCARPRIPEVSSPFISFSTQLPSARDYFWSAASQTVNLASLNASSLRAYMIPFPPSGEQLRIVAKVKSLFAQADSIKLHTEFALRHTGHTEQALLAKTFRGEL